MSITSSTTRHQQHRSRYALRSTAATSPEALDAMVGTALYGDGDWKELQEFHLQLLEHEDTEAVPSPQPA